MSKPSWKNAPPWANWLAMDRDNGWWWYTLEPRLFKNGLFWVSQDREELIGFSTDNGIDSADTLEKRP